MKFSRNQMNDDDLELGGCVKVCWCVLQVNQYAPGLVESVSASASQAWDLARDYALWLCSLVLKYLSVSAAWLRDNVFV